MYLYFHLEFKICCTHIFSKWKLSYSNLQRSTTRSLQERSLDRGRALKSVHLIQSTVHCRANIEQFNHQCFERSAKICEPLDIETKKPTIQMLYS
jgi:hypothetical protein